MKIFNFPTISSIDLAGGGVAILLTAAFGLGVLQPFHNKTKQAAANTEAVARDREHLATLQATIQTMYADVAQINSKMSGSRVRLLSLSKLNTRLAEVASLAHDCNLSIQDLKPGESAVTAHYISAPILMTGSGNYCDAAGMIHLLHERLPDMDVKTFRLIGNLDEPKFNCNFELQLEWRAALELLSGPALQRTADLR
jgi:hypothetical protein